MTDRHLISELRAAIHRPHVDLTDGEREFVRRLEDRGQLTDDERERAEQIFRERVDW